jgi:hypothetical protein
VPTTETDNTPATTNNTVDNEPAEIQNKIQDNNKITSKMTPTDHIISATALQSADAVNLNMRTLQKSNETLHNANFLHQSWVILETGI